MDVCAGPRLDLELLGISQPPFVVLRAACSAYRETTRVRMIPTVAAAVIQSIAFQ